MIALTLDGFNAPIHNRTTEQAAKLLGKRWYQLNAGPNHIGYLINDVRLDDQGNYEFITQVSLSVLPGRNTSSKDMFRFSKAPPFDLLLAVHEEHEPTLSRSITVVPSGEMYIAELQEESSKRDISSTEIKLSFTLSDYLSLENWLNLDSPATGASKSIKTLNLRALEIQTNTLKVVRKIGKQYQVGSTDHGSPILLILDEKHIPSSIDIGRTLNLSRVTEKQALAYTNHLIKPNSFIPVNQKIVHPEQIRNIELVLSGHEYLHGNWTHFISTSDPTVLSIKNNPVDLNSPISEIPNNYPLHKDIVNLAKKATAEGKSTHEKLSLLNDFVNKYLIYSEKNEPTTLLNLLRRRTGDCTEFADLFTTMAHSLNIPAKTVFGLAYYDSEAPMFRFHAWNEVLIDGVRTTIDPTWNQFPADATHIPFSESWSALDMLIGQGNFSFTIKSIKYF